MCHTDADVRFVEGMEETMPDTIMRHNHMCDTLVIIVIIILFYNHQSVYRGII